MILNILPVIPPDLRQYLPDDGGRFASSDLNDLTAVSSPLTVWLVCLVILGIIVESVCFKLIMIKSWSSDRDQANITEIVSHMLKETERFRQKLAR